MFKLRQIAIALALVATHAMTGCNQPNQTKSIEQLTREREQEKAREQHFNNVLTIMEGDGEALKREVKR